MSILPEVNMNLLSNLFSFTGHFLFCCNKEELNEYCKINSISTTMAYVQIPKGNDDLHAGVTAVQDEYL